MAAHLHDSVLQTLALMQQRADDPREVAALARRQERELRAWLGRRPATGRRRATLGGGARGRRRRRRGATTACRSRSSRSATRALDERGEALVAAAREAMVNAAKFGGGSPVDVYAEATRRRASQVFVRDRGPGLRPRRGARRPARRARVDRRAHGAPRRHAPTIHSAPGAGTEVELTLPRSARA